MTDKEKPKKTVVKKDETKKKKVVKLKPSNVVESLEALLELAKEGNIDCFVFAGFSTNDEIVTSTCDTSVLDHQSLVGYLQSLATIRLISDAVEVLDFE